MGRILWSGGLRTHASRLGFRSLFLGIAFLVEAWEETLYQGDFDVGDVVCGGLGLETWQLEASVGKGSVNRTFEPGLADKNS